MTIARRMYLFVAGVFACLVAGSATEVVAQDGGGLTCGWCVHGVHNLAEVPGGFEGDLKHIFPYGGNGCGWQGHDNPTRVYHTIPIPTRLLVELRSAAGARNATPGSLQRPRDGFVIGTLRRSDRR